MSFSVLLLCVQLISAQPELWQQNRRCYT